MIHTKFSDFHVYFWGWEWEWEWVGSKWGSK
jgi:hypothetical protein